MTDAVATDADIVGQLDSGWHVLIALMLHERTGIGAELFTLEKQFNDTVKLAQQYKINGRPLIEDPFIRQKIGGLLCACAWIAIKLL